MPCMHVCTEVTGLIFPLKWVDETWRILWSKSQKWVQNILILTLEWNLTPSVGDQDTSGRGGRVGVETVALASATGYTLMHYIRSHKNPLQLLLVSRIFSLLWIMRGGVQVLDVPKSDLLPQIPPMTTEMDPFLAPGEAVHPSQWRVVLPLLPRYSPSWHFCFTHFYVGVADALVNVNLVCMLDLLFGIIAPLVQYQNQMLVWNSVWN